MLSSGNERAKTEYSTYPIWVLFFSNPQPKNTENCGFSCFVWKLFKVRSLNYVYNRPSMRLKININSGHFK